MKKKFILVFTALALMFSLVACGASETANAKTTVDEFIKAVKELDQEKMLSLVASDEKADLDVTEDVDKESSEYKSGKAMVSKLAGSYVSGEVAKDATETTLKYKVDSPDIQTMIGDMYAKVLKGEKTENLEIKEEDIKVVQKDVDFKLVKEDGAWKIKDVKPLMMDMMNLGGLSQFVK